ATIAHLGLWKGSDRWHLPASSRGPLSVARLARNPVGAALDRPERPPRPGEDIALHERDDVGLASFLSARCNGIVGRVRDGRRRAVQTDDDTEDGDEHGDDGA